MDLQIAYECPRCNRTLLRPLEELRPGRYSACHNCGVPVSLTDKSLDTLRRDLDGMPTAVDS